ncbi:MAG: glycoside hydrolase family 31 protein [Tepidisphaeraceae bacterium]
MFRYAITPGRGTNDGMTNHARRTVLCAGLLTLATTGILKAADAVIVEGDARFTVVTDNCVRLEYAPGGKFIDDKSMFAVNRDARAEHVDVKRDGKTIIITTPALTLRYTPDGKPFSPENLSADIKVEGTPSHWTPGLHNSGNLGGTVRTLDTYDGGGDLGQGLLSRDGWYVLDDSHSALFTQDWVRARPQDAGTDWYLFAYGRDYRAALKSLTAIGGAVPMPRKYVLGTWYSRYWPYTSDEFRAIVKEYEQHDFPLDMMVLDMDWHRDGWTGYSWNRELLPDAEGLLKWLHEQGLHVTLNDHPADGLKPHEDAYPAFMRAMGEDPASKQTIPYDAGNQKYLTTFYDTVMRPLVKDGVDFWWLDWQQYPNTRSIPSLTNLFWLNHFYFQRTGEDDRRGQIFSRWGGWGSHRYPIQFSGDASTAFHMLAFEVPFTSTAGNVGCFFWSHDIGGHNMGRNEESYARWCQFGATTTALRSHSTRDKNMDRRPWAYPKYVEDSIRISFHLRSTLMPYVYSAVAQSTSQSVPLNRAMYFDYPNEERAYHSSQEYLFGDHLLAAPIAMPGVGPRRVGWQAVWFPPGDAWFNLYTGEHYEGGTEQLVAADIDESPLYMRAGVPLPMRPYSNRPTTAPLDTLVLRCYPGAEGKTGTFTLYEDDGVSVGYTRGASATTKLSYTYANGTVTIRVEPTEGKYDGQLEQRAITVELPATAKASSVSADGAESSYDETTFTNTIKLPARSIRQGATITVATKPAGTEALRDAAAARRGGFTKQADASLALKQRLAKALAESKDEANLPAVLASFGIATFEKNETTYRWPDGGTFGLYAPEGLIDNDHVIYADAGGTDKTVPTKLQRDATVGGLAPLDRPKSMGTLQPTARSKTVLSFSVDGRQVSLPGQDTPTDFAASPLNVAPKAHVTASTETNDSRAVGVTDGIVDGYPHVRRHEWSSESEKDGAWVELKWDEPQRIDRVWLFDRPNGADQVTAGEIVFDDGKTVSFKALPNDAANAAEVKFAARETRSLRIRVSDVSRRTENIGLAEVVVLKVLPR